MRVLFFGSSGFSVPSLKSIAASVQGVVTRRQKPKGRGYLLEDSEVKRAAAALGLPVIEIDSFKDEAAFRLAELKPDLLVVASFGLIIPKWFLEIPTVGPLNIHPSLLPRYRGPSPIQWTILHRDNETGVTFIRMTEKMDSGDILYQERVPVMAEENSDSLSERLAQKAAALLPGVIGKVMKNGIDSGTPQSEEDATYTPIIRKEMGRIDWNTTADEVIGQVRAFVSWPTAFTYLDGRLLKIFEAKTVLSTPLSLTKPGTIIALEQRGVEVAVKEGSVVITEVQLENKRRMPAIEFSRGYRELTKRVFQ